MPVMSARLVMAAGSTPGGRRRLPSGLARCGTRWNLAGADGTVGRRIADAAGPSSGWTQQDLADRLGDLPGGGVAPRGRASIDPGERTVALLAGAVRARAPRAGRRHRLPAGQGRAAARWSSPATPRSSSSSRCSSATRRGSSAPTTPRRVGGSGCGRCSTTPTTRSSARCSPPRSAACTGSDAGAGPVPDSPGGMGGPVVERSWPA